MIQMEAKAVHQLKMPMLATTSHRIDTTVE